MLRVSELVQGYVSEDEAGRRLAAVMSSDDYKQSGAYWSWSNDSEAFVNTLSEEAQARCPACPSQLQLFVAPSLC